MDQGSRERISAFGVPRCPLGTGRVSSCVRPQTSQAERLVHAPTTSPSRLSGSPSSLIVNFRKEHALRPKLRSSTDPSTPTEHAVGMAHESRAPILHAEL